MCWLPTSNEKKKRHIRRVVGCLPQRSVVLAEDETDLLLFPPLRAMWSLRGVPAEVLLNGWNARRTVFGVSAQSSRLDETSWGRWTN
jgi:hypothetical protein